MLEDLKILCGLDGTSGREEEVREYIIARIAGKTRYSVDRLGNIIAFKKGARTPRNKIMLDAHMDEVGFIITAIQSDGMLKFAPIGGVEPSAAAGRQIKVNGLYGVVGTKAVHNLSAEEREKALEMDALYIDIGAADREDAEKYVSAGDCAYFASEYTEPGGETIMSKAIDDRFGCALLLELIDSELPFDMHFTFTVQEEIGLRGAKTAAYTVEPDIAIVVEATTAADIDTVPESGQVCRLGRGAVVSFMDRSTMYDRQLYELALKLAEEKDIPCQTKNVVAGGNNSGAIHMSRSGVKTIAVSAPCRYLHSQSCIVNKSDLTACRELIAAMIERAAELEL